jgi:hypothetical protein
MGEPWIVTLWIMIKPLRSHMAGMRDQDLKSNRLPLIFISLSQEMRSQIFEEVFCEDSVEADSVEACHRGTSSLKGEEVAMLKAFQSHKDQKCHSLSETSMGQGSLIQRFMTLT